MRDRPGRRGRLRARPRRPRQVGSPIVVFQPLRRQKTRGRATRRRRALRREPRSSDWPYDTAYLAGVKCTVTVTGVKCTVTVTPDFFEAAKWYRKAADQGDLVGQAQLADAYFRGLGVPQDYVQAYAWFSLAASNSLLFDESQGAKIEDAKKLHETAAKMRDQLGIIMTSTQLDEARDRVIELNNK